MNIIDSSNSAPYGQDFHVRLAEIVRSLHDALAEIGADSVLKNALVEFPATRQRLNHIGKLTESAANKVLERVEVFSPTMQQLADNANCMRQRFREASVINGFSNTDRKLIFDINAFFERVVIDSTAMQVALSEMMLAQDFQDLTGQLLKKVMVLLEATENDLLRLLVDAIPNERRANTNTADGLAGPGAPGGVALDQMNVDDLLEDLGF